MLEVALVGDGFGFHVPKGYSYVAMGFSVAVDGLNMIRRDRRIKAAGGDQA